MSIIVDALNASRAFVVEELQVRLESLCLLDADLKPRRDTLHPEDESTHILPAENLIKQIDRALADALAAQNRKGEAA